MKVFFKKANKKLLQKLKIFLRQLNIPKLPEGKLKLCGEDLTEEIYTCL